jgi:hypothetical protein
MEELRESVAGLHRGVVHNVERQDVGDVRGMLIHRADRQPEPCPSRVRDVVEINGRGARRYPAAMPRSSEADMAC